MNICTWTKLVVPYASTKKIDYTVIRLFFKVMWFATWFMVVLAILLISGLLCVAYIIQIPVTSLTANICISSNLNTNAIDYENKLLRHSYKLLRHSYRLSFKLEKPYIWTFKKDFQRNWYSTKTSSLCFYPNFVTNLLYNYLFFSNIFVLACGNSYVTNIKSLIILQKRAVRIITFSDYRAHASPLFKTLNLLKFPDIVKLQYILALSCYSIAKTYSRLTLITCSLR